MAQAQGIAPRARRMTADEWLARAAAIAERDHLVYRSRYGGENARGEHIFSSPSRSQPGEWYTQRVDACERWTCSCMAGRWSMPCGHVGASAHLWRQMCAAMSEAGLAAQRNYEAFGVELERRGY